MIRKIVTYPNPVLSGISKPIEIFDDSIRTLLNDMAEIMYVADGVGLAAPQIGVEQRAIVLDVGEAGPGLLKMVNPEILSREGEIEWEEGCLSMPDFRVVMKRSKRIRVRFMDENGATQEMVAEDLLAVAIQHEIDHLDGKLIIDNVSRLKRDLYIKKRKKEEKHARESIVL